MKDISDERAPEAAEAPVYIASWAPADPRDRLYDSNASEREKLESVVRIIAAFHPVLNTFVLSHDMIRRMGWPGLLGLALVAGAVILAIQSL